MTSRFGNKVQVGPPDHVSLDGYVMCRRIEDGADREYHLSDLIADDDADKAWFLEVAKVTRND